ncbi:MAG: helix-turn-helix domain-containing protein [Pseudomonadota bacterium]
MAKRASAPDDEERKCFVFLLEEGFTMLALSSAIEVLRLARKLRGPERCDYLIAALTPGLVKASNGVEVMAPGRLADAPRRATILVVSGAGAVARRNERLVAEIRRLRREGHPIWGVSSGVVRLAEAGLFGRRPFAVAGARLRIAAHWEDAPYLRAAFPELELTTSLFEHAGDLATCAGGGAAADLMLDVLRRSDDVELVEEIVARLIIDGVRDGRMAQTQAIDLRLATTDGTVFSALRLMRAHLYEPLPIGEIARRCQVAQRQLERLFQKELQAAPLRVYREIRLAGARQEVLAGRRPIGDIALDYGFSGDRFARAYRARYGVAPCDDRRKRDRD